MKLNNKKLLIFDLDGTLIDSSGDLALAVNHTLNTLNLPTYDLDTIHHWVGNGAEILVKRALSGSTTIDTTLEESYWREALKIFLDFYAKNLAVATVTYPNVPSTLKMLKVRGYRLAIVTNKPYPFVEPILEALGLDNVFELILGGDSLEKKKPDPMPLLYVCTKLGITPNKSVMIGDSKNDILASKSANMDSIGVTYGYNYGESIERYKPTVVYNQFEDILKSLP